MPEFKSGGLSVDEHFDRDGDLWISVVDREDYIHSEYLPRVDVIRLRDHLNTLLGVAS